MAAQASVSFSMVHLRNRIVSSLAIPILKIFPEETFPMTRVRRMVLHASLRTFAKVICAACLLASTFTYAQLFTFPRQDLVDYTAKSPFDRFSDGRPKVPDSMIERARGLSAEEVWATLQEKGYNNQYADGFQILHPGKTMVG